MARSTSSAAEKAKPKAKKAEGTRRRWRLRLGIPRLLRPITSYFGGAWRELGQVMWPNRRATWGLTLAVMLFSAFFAILILGLDTLFNYLFKEVLL